MSHMVRNSDFCLCENKGADQLHSNCTVPFVFATQIVQSLFSLNPKFQDSSLLRLYRLVYVRPGRKPRRPVFSRCGSHDVYYDSLIITSGASSD